MEEETLVVGEETSMGNTHMKGKITWRKNSRRGAGGNSHRG